MAPPDTYKILTTDFGQAFQCLRCGLISYNEEDAKQRYCGHCKLFHNGSPLPPLTIHEIQVIYTRLYRFLIAEEAMRKRVFQPGDSRRQEKLTAAAQAITDLQILKDLIKAQFQLTN